MHHKSFPTVSVQLLGYLSFFTRSKCPLLILTNGAIYDVREVRKENNLAFHVVTFLNIPINQNRQVASVTLFYPSCTAVVCFIILLSSDL